MYALSGCDESVLEFSAFYRTRSEADVAMLCACWPTRLWLCRTDVVSHYANEHTLTELCLRWMNLSATTEFSAELEERARAICWEMRARDLAHIEYTSQQISLRLTKDLVVSYRNPAPCFHKMRVSSDGPVPCRQRRRGWLDIRPDRR